MKIFGFFLLLLGALAFSREYSRYVKKHISECEEFIAFIKHMRLELKCFLKPPREIARTFEGKAIKPFLDSLESAESIRAAFDSARGRFSLSEEEGRALEELFSSIGSCYADDGVKLIDTATERLTSLHADLCESAGRGARIVAVVSTALTVGIFSLLV